MNNFSERPSILDNPHAERVKKVAALAGRSARFKHGKILVEGPQAVRELIRDRSSFVEDVYYSASAARLHSELISEATQACRWVHEVSDEVAQAISRDSQGICAVARAEAIETSLPEIQSGDTLVVIAQGRDPGNVGTIMRTADAMGARAIISVKGSVDSSSPKVIRSSAGFWRGLPDFARHECCNPRDFRCARCLQPDLINVVCRLGKTRLACSNPCMGLRKRGTGNER